MHEEGSRGKGGKVVGGKVVGGENPGRTRHTAAAVNKEDRRGDKCSGLDMLDIGYLWYPESGSLHRFGPVNIGRETHEFGRRGKRETHWR